MGSCGSNLKTNEYILNHNTKSKASLQALKIMDRNLLKASSSPNVTEGSQISGITPGANFKIGSQAQEEGKAGGKISKSSSLATENYFEIVDSFTKELLGYCAVNNEISIVIPHLCTIEQSSLLSNRVCGSNINP